MYSNRALYENQLMHKAQHPQYHRSKFTTWSSFIQEIHSSNQDICSNFLLEDIDLQLLYKGWTSLAWADVGLESLSPC